MIIIDDTYQVTNEKFRGRKPKFGLKKDNKKYIFKYGSINYEIWAELIAEQLGLQAGIEMAHYEIASFNGVLGVITPNFISDGELIIASDNLKKAIQQIYADNNIDGDLKDNSVINIVESAWVYDNRLNLEEISYNLMKRWAFAGLILESDKNETNISFIKGKDTLRLSPDYDNSSIAQLNKNINQFIESLKRGYSVYSLIDSVNNSLYLSESDKDKNFLERFKLFTQKYPIQCDFCMECFRNINVDEAIARVEQINDVEVPWEVKFWVNKVISCRLKDMENIVKKVNANNIKVL